MRKRVFRLADGPAYVQAFAVTGVTTVLVTRAYLALTGYPKIGGGSLHIGHVLWGGLLMLIALVVALLHAGVGRARVWTALLGGVGLGLFVDEIGKYLTTTNDYFYRPAAAIIYIVFAGLMVLTAHLGRWNPTDPRDRLANAAHIATNGFAGGLTPGKRQFAQELLAGRDDEAADAVRRLLDSSPVIERPPLVRRLLRRPLALAERLADLRLFDLAVVTLFTVTRVVVAIVFVVQALELAAGEHLSAGTDDGAVVIQAFTRTLAAVLAIVAATMWRGDRTASYRWFRTALLVDLLITQIFNFTDSQFRAVAELPFDLVVLALTNYRLRSRHAPMT